MGKKTSVSKRLDAPEGLGESGSVLWERVAAKYEFRPDEVRVLEDAARTADRISAMEAELGSAVTSVGSLGQVVVHPLIPEIRQQRAALASFMRQLNLPDEDSAAGESPRSVQARKAAQSRWAAAHGAAS